MSYENAPDGIGVHAPYPPVKMTWKEWAEVPFQIVFFPFWCLMLFGAIGLNKLHEARRG